MSDQKEKKGLVSKVLDIPVTRRQVLKGAAAGAAAAVMPPSNQLIRKRMAMGAGDAGVASKAAAAVMPRMAMGAGDAGVASKAAPAFWEIAEPKKVHLSGLRYQMGLELTPEDLKHLKIFADPGVAEKFAERMAGEYNLWNKMHPPGDGLRASTNWYEPLHLWAKNPGVLAHSRMAPNMGRYGSAIGPRSRQAMIGLMEIAKAHPEQNIFGAEYLKMLTPDGAKLARLDLESGGKVLKANSLYNGEDAASKPSSIETEKGGKSRPEKIETEKGGKSRPEKKAKDLFKKAGKVVKSALQVTPMELAAGALLYSSDLGDATRGNTMLTPEESEAALNEQRKQEYQHNRGLVSGARIGQAL